MSSGAQDESVFYVNGPEAQQLSTVPIAELELTERQHVPEWVIANPSVVSRTCWC